jgi:hypothetical protein
MDTPTNFEEIPEGAVDITPEDSSCPVYLIPEPEEMVLERERLVAASEAIKSTELAQETARQSALAKLAKLGLTEEEARAVIGL